MLVKTIFVPELLKEIAKGIFYNMLAKEKQYLLLAPMAVASFAFFL